MTAIANIARFRIEYYVESERMRILGQSGSGVFEKHYQSDFIGGLQEVVLLRPSQEALLREARKCRNRDPLAPTELDDNQLNAINRNPRVLELRGEKLKLMHEMRSLAGTVEAAKDLYPELCQQHEEVCKRLEKVRRTLRQTSSDKSTPQPFCRRNSSVSSHLAFSFSNACGFPQAYSSPLV